MVGPAVDYAALIAELRAYGDYAGGIMRRAADAIEELMRPERGSAESQAPDLWTRVRRAEAERDAALARIAAVEHILRHTRPGDWVSADVLTAALRAAEQVRPAAYAIAPHQFAPWPDRQEVLCSRLGCNRPASHEVHQHGTIHRVGCTNPAHEGCPDWGK